ncbi:hypothetical protein AAVH_14089 [Aphelenchoides avenae]|nr:hypothetical protein AAVH_14089 [Aphelenchus avenae]
MMFGGTWYCYIGHEMTDATPSYDIIANNYCADIVAGSNVVKITEEREYGYMYDWWPDQAVYLGLVLQSGTTSTFTW